MPRICPRCGDIAADTDTFCHQDGTMLEEHPVTPHQEASYHRMQPEAPAQSQREAYLGKVLLGQFEIQEICGSGSMGTVYKARQLEIDRTVAVKILHPELASQPEAVLRFHREAKVVSTLSHPNIVHIYLFGHLPDGNLYIVQEFVRGRSLAEDMKRGPLGLRRTLHIVDQILSAMSEAHGHGVVHRDLKPENIMLCTVGEDTDFVKILDFGVAKRIAAQTFATRDGLIFGSPRYISPEAAQGEKVDQRSDLYSLGVILYQMLSGEPPFDSRKPIQLLMDHVRTTPPPLSSRPGAADVPHQVEGIVMKLLGKKPEHRYPTALATREALADATRPAAASAAPYPHAPVAPAQSIPAPYAKAAPPTIEDRPAPRIPTAQAAAQFAPTQVSVPPSIGEPVSDSDLDTDEEVTSTEAMYSMQHRSRTVRKILVTLLVLFFVPVLLVGFYFGYRALSKRLFTYDKVAHTGEETEPAPKPDAAVAPEEPPPPLTAKVSLDTVEPLVDAEVKLTATVTGLAGSDKCWFVVRDVAGGEVRVVARQVQVQGDGTSGRVFTATHIFDFPGPFIVTFLAGDEEIRPGLGLEVTEPEKSGKGKKKKTPVIPDFGPDVPVKVPPPDDKPDKPPDKDGGSIKIIKVAPDDKPDKKSSWY